MANVILYVRVSTDEQAAKGTSLPYQKERLAQFCSVADHTTLKVFSEDYSAKNFEDRPEFNRLLAFLKENKGIVEKLLVLRWDRFSRNAPEAYNMIAKLSKLGIEVNAIEQPIDFSIPEQKMMLSFYLTIPEIENDRRALNTTNGMRKNIREGRWVSSAPIGYKNTRDERNKPLLVKTEKAALVKKAFKLLASGNYPIDVLRVKMNGEGLKLTRNSFWMMLRNPVYCGSIRLKAYKNEPEEIVKGIHEPIVSEELFNEVQGVLEGKKRIKAKPTRARTEFPMRGHLVCSCCGGNLTASRSKGNGGEYLYYHCQPGCKERGEARTMHRSFDKWLTSIAFKPDVGRLYLKVIESVFKTNEKDREGEIVKLEAEIAKKEAMLDSAVKKRVNEEIDLDDYKRLKASLLKECTDLRVRISELKNTEDGFMEYMHFGVSFLTHLPQYYSTATLEGKQRILGSIFPEKLIFSENTYRTAEPSELITLLTTVDKAFGRSANKKTAQKRGLSCVVALRGIEPPFKV